MNRLGGKDTLSFDCNGQHAKGQKCPFPLISCKLLQLDGVNAHYGQGLMHEKSETSEAELKRELQPKPVGTMGRFAYPCIDRTPVPE